MISIPAYNATSGYLEGLCHGFKNTLLSGEDYFHLTQCQTLEDIRIHLEQSTDYKAFFAESELKSRFYIRDFEEHLENKLFAEYFYIKSQAETELYKFLEYYSYSYMIENLLLLLTGTLHNKPIEDLLRHCHPIGTFELMESIHVATSAAELYTAVLCDTPLAPFFIDCISEDDLDEVHIELIRNRIYKRYYENFYKFCEEIGGVTEINMKEILYFEADRRSIVLTLNAIENNLLTGIRFELYPRLGYLFEIGALDSLSKCQTYDEVRSLVCGIPQYCKLFDEIEGNSSQMLEDKFFEHEAMLNKSSFLSLFHYGTFFSYFRLREQEIRNVIWICECVAQNHRDEVQNFVRLF